MYRPLGDSELHVSPLCLGGNVFGWTANQDESFAVLDAYADAGGNFIDTADTYSSWVPGHIGGESESIVGDWLQRRGRRSEFVIATKVAKRPEFRGLAPFNIQTSVDGSLARLKTDYIDLYYAHEDDETVPVADVLGAFTELIAQGKVRYIAASNFSAARLAEALDVSQSLGLARYIAVQPHYNLLKRDEYEGALRDVCVAHDVACVPYFGLARGFLTGKYRDGLEVESARAGGVTMYRNDRGWRTLAALDEVAAAHGTSVAAVALAWVKAQPTVAAPIASARTLPQFVEILPMQELTLLPDELSALAAAAS